MAARRRVYGKNSLIPSPFDPRLILRIAPAVARAAMESGVAKKPIEDFDAYQEKLERTVFRSGFIMKPLMLAAKAAPKRVVYAEGEDERVLRAVQSVIEEGIAHPILIGRRAVVEKRHRGSSACPRDRHAISQLVDPAERSALQRLRRHAAVGRGPARHQSQHGAHPGAHQYHRHRRAGARARRGRRPALRAGRAVRARACATCATSSGSRRASANIRR